MINNYIEYLKSITGGAGELEKYKSDLQSMINILSPQIEEIIIEKQKTKHNIEDERKKAEEAVNKYKNKELTKKEKNNLVIEFNKKNSKLTEEINNDIERLENLKESKDYKDWEQVAHYLAPAKFTPLQIKYKLDIGKSNEEKLIETINKNIDNNPYYEEYKGLKKRSSNEFDSIDFIVKDKKSGKTKYNIELKTRLIPSFAVYNDSMFGVNKIEEAIEEEKKGNPSEFKFWVYTPDNNGLYEATYSPEMREDFEDEYKKYLEYTTANDKYLKLDKKINNLIKDDKFDISKHQKYVDELDDLEDRLKFLNKKDFGGVFLNQAQKNNKGTFKPKLYYGIPRYFFTNISGDGFIDKKPELFKKSYHNKYNPKFSDYKTKFNNITVYDF